MIFLRSMNGSALHRWRMRLPGSDAKVLFMHYWPGSCQRLPWHQLLFSSWMPTRTRQKSLTAEHTTHTQWTPQRIKLETGTNMEAYPLWLPERYYAGCWDGKAIKCTHAIHPVCYSDGLAERYPHRGSSGMTIPRGANYFLVDGYCVIYCSILKHSGRG